MFYGTRGIVLSALFSLGTILFVLVRANAWQKNLVRSLVAAVVALIVTAILTSLLSGLFYLQGLLFQALQIVLGMGILFSVSYAAGHVILTREDGWTSLYQRGAVLRPIPTAPSPTPATGQTSDRSTGQRAPHRPHDEPAAVGEIDLTLEDETRHSMMIGSTGTGKSTAIRRVVRTGIARGDLVIIADPGYGYVSAFRDASRGDVLINAFDSRSPRWSIFAEIATTADVEHVVRALIPDSGGLDKQWEAYARTFVTALIRQLIRAGCRDDKELLRLVTTAEVSELRTLLAGTPAGPFVSPDNGRMFDSVRSVASSALAVLQHTTAQEGPPFSIRKWVRDKAARANGGQGGVMFLPYKANQIAVLCTVIPAMLRLAIFEAMAKEEGDHRLWIVVDELDALGAIDGLSDALARLRKYGGRCILGWQSIAQVYGVYGRAHAATIVENCGNILILRCSSSEQGGTAKFASELVGDREVIQPSTSTIRGAFSLRPSFTHSRHKAIEPAVLASEIERFPDLKGIFKRATDGDWYYVQLIPDNGGRPNKPSGDTHV